VSTYDVGDAVKLSTTVKDFAGTPTDATVVLTLTKPDGTTSTPAVTDEAGTGNYSSTFNVDQVGTWLYKWAASGAVVATDTRGLQLEVLAQRTYVASLADLKKQLNIQASVTTHDDELLDYLASATDFVEWAVEGPMSVQTFTERLTTRSCHLITTHRPVTEIVSVAPVYGQVVGTALNAAYYRIDTVVEAIELLSYGAGRYQVTYKAGLSGIPADRGLAGRIIAQHLWQLQNGGSGRPSLNDEALTMLPGAAYAIPNRAAELLKRSQLYGIA